MSQLDPFEVEGRLNGLREMLAMVVTHLAGRDGGEALYAALEQRLVPADHQEDPGAVPQPALAVDAAATREVRLVLNQVSAQLSDQDDARQISGISPPSRSQYIR